MGVNGNTDHAPCIINRPRDRTMATARRVHPALHELRQVVGSGRLQDLANLLGFPVPTVNSWYYLHRTPRGSQIAAIRDRTAETERPIRFEDFYPLPDSAD